MRRLQSAKKMSWLENELVSLAVSQGVTAGLHSDNNNHRNATQLVATCGMEPPHPSYSILHEDTRLWLVCPGSPREILKAWQKSKKDFSFFCQRRRKKWVSLGFVGLWKISGVSLLRSAPLRELWCTEEFNQKTPRSECLLLSLLVRGLAPSQGGSQVMEASFPVTDNPETSNSSVAQGKALLLLSVLSSAASTSPAYLSDKAHSAERRSSLDRTEVDRAIFTPVLVILHSNYSPC